MYRPRICSIELFRKCCLHCRMCYMWRHTDSDGGLERGPLESLAGQLGEVMSGEKEVTLSGGEPLLHEDLIDIVRIYSNKKLKVGIASNGVLLTKRTTSALVKAGLKNIQLSFDSSNEQTHNFLRGTEGAYKRVLEGARNLSSYRNEIIVCAQTVISGRNLQEIVETIKFVSDKKYFDSISFMAVTEPFFTKSEGDWRLNPEFSFLWPKEAELVNRVFDEIIAMKENGYPIANPVAHLELFRDYFLYPQRRKPGQQCLLGEYVLSIEPTGDAKLCCFMEPVGNIKRQSLADILGAELVCQIRNSMRNCTKTCNTLVNCFFRENAP